MFLSSFSGLEVSPGVYLYLIIVSREKFSVVFYSYTKNVFVNKNGDPNTNSKKVHSVGLDPLRDLSGEVVCGRQKGKLTLRQPGTF